MPSTSEITAIPTFEHLVDLPPPTNKGEGRKYGQDDRSVQNKLSWGHPPKHEPGWVDRLTVTQGNRRSFRFWQAGGGFDRNIWEQKTLTEVIDYIHANPVRRGLVEKPTDWEWSSSRFWAGMVTPMKMDRLG